MRKKILSLGLSAVTAGSIAFGAMAPAAHANVVTDVCNAIPGVLVTAGNELSSATSAAGLAGSVLGTKEAALTSATTAYVNALVAHLQAVGAGTSTTITEPAFVGATNDLGAKFVEWANANVSNFNAEQALRIAQMKSSIVQGLGGGLCS